jgi:hypothetical protein
MKSKLSKNITDPSRMGRDVITVRNKIRELESSHKRWKRQPWNERREHALGVLAHELRIQRKLLKTLLS